MRRTRRRVGKWDALRPISMGCPLELQQADEPIRAQMASRLAEPLPKSSRRSRPWVRESAESLGLFVDALEATCFERKLARVKTWGWRSKASPLFTGRGAGPKKGLHPLTERGGASKCA